MMSTNAQKRARLLYNEANREASVHVPATRPSTIAAHRHSLGYAVRRFPFDLLSTEKIRTHWPRAARALDILREKMKDSLTVTYFSLRGLCRHSVLI